MQNKFSYTQARKGDPIAQMSSAQNRSTLHQSAGQFPGYRLNTRIRALRTSRGWSQAELGEKLAEIMGSDKKIPTSTIASWEHKNAAIAKIPALDKINALSSLFGVTVDYLKGFSDDPKKSAMEYISTQADIQNIEILPQELAQHMGEPVWISCEKYDGWMLLTNLYELIDCNGEKHSVSEICHLNAVFSVFPPCHVYFKQVYNRYVIPENQIRNYRERMWVCINSPDKQLQNYNGWYERTSDGMGVKGKTLLSYDSYFDFWIAYTTPLLD